MNQTKFLQSFPQTNKEKWQLKIENDLHGKTFDNLISIDRNGIAIYPFYTNEDACKSMNLQVQKDWYILQQFTVLPGQELAQNQQLLDALQNGVNGLKLIIPQTIDFTTLFNEIVIQAVFVYIKTDNDAVIQQYQEYVQNKNNSSDNNNYFIENKDGVYFDKQGIYIAGHIFNNAGANAVWENGILLSLLKQSIEDYHLKNDIAHLKNIIINVAVDTNYFEQIAKLMALRSTIKFLCENYQISPNVYIITTTSSIYHTNTQPANNLIRDCIALMAAVLGHCDAAIGNNFLASDIELSQRMSKNQQLILKEESFFNQVSNMADGAYFISYYSEAIAEKCWKVFQEIESNGGFNASLKSGMILQNIQDQFNALIQKYKSGEKKLTGVTHYVSDTETQDAKFEKFTKFGITSMNLEEVFNIV